MTAKRCRCGTQVNKIYREWDIGTFQHLPGQAQFSAYIFSSQNADVKVGDGHMRARSPGTEQVDRAFLVLEHAGQYGFDLRQMTTLD